METIMILGGRKDKIRKGDLLGALTGDAAGLSGKDIGMIEIQDKALLRRGFTGSREESRVVPQQGQGERKALPRASGGEVGGVTRLR